MNMPSRMDEIKVFIEDLKKDSMVHKHLASGYISGSSTEVYPIMINMNKSVTLLWNTDRKLYDKWIARVVQSHSLVDYGYFWKSDGSCPSRIVFVFN